MLVLTRKVGDVIAIGDNIKIVVMAIKGKQVRLGVQADRSTVVHREEIYQKIQQETKAALQSDVSSTKAAGDLLRNAGDQNANGFSGLDGQKNSSGLSGRGAVLKKSTSSSDSTPENESEPDEKKIKNKK